MTDTWRRELVDVLAAVRELLSRRDNDFSWSSWTDSRAALSEIDALIEWIAADGPPSRDGFGVLFAPTGPIHEMAVSSGWAQEFAALADRFDAVVAALGPPTGPEPPDQADFVCALCGQWAGSVQLRGTGETTAIRRSSFTSTLEGRVAPHARAAVQDALTSRDPRSLFEIDLEYAPFYCPACDACYCGDHWRRWDVFDDDDQNWHDSIRGECPQGHQRMLED